MCISRVLGIVILAGLRGEFPEAAGERPELQRSFASLRMTEGKNAIKGKGSGRGRLLLPHEHTIRSQRHPIQLRKRAKRANYCVAKNATRRAARSGPSSGKERLPSRDDKFKN